jgi:hypothetical protein
MRKSFLLIAVFALSSATPQLVSADKPPPDRKSNVAFKLLRDDCKRAPCERLAPIAKICITVKLDDDDWRYVVKRGKSCWWATREHRKYRSRDFKAQEVEWCQPPGTKSYYFVGPVTKVRYEFDFTE